MQIGDIYKSKETHELGTLEILGEMSGIYYLRLSSGALIAISKVLLLERWIKQ